MRLVALLALTSSLLVATAPYVEVADECSLELLTPQLAERKWTKVRLQNGLEAYLVSDPGAPLSGAAVAVEVGSWHEPAAYPGMAHLLEHLLFMGSHAYPNEAEFMQYLADHGGLTNAATFPDRTIYYFSVESSAFKETFDRFSHFFTDPLLASSSKAGELKVVDQEHQKNLENDMRRMIAVYQATANQEHPFARFATGNSETLGKIPMKDLHAWFSTAYSPKAMHLIAVSPLPLEEMKEIVVAHYGDLPAAAPLQLSLPQELTSPAQRGHLISLSPIEEKRELTIVWELPKDLFAAKPMIELVAQSLSRKGEGTLFELLKQEGLVLDLGASVDHEGEGILFFIMNARLTEKGVQAKDNVILKLFSALHTLKAQGLTADLLDDSAWSARLSYAFQLRGHPFKVLYQAAYDLMDEPLASYPEKTLLPRGDEMGRLPELFSWLKPERATYFLSAEEQLLPTELDQMEPWMGVPYAIQSIPTERLQTFAKAPADPRLTAFKPTSFLPNDIDLPFKVADVDPHQLVHDEKGTLYLAPDIDFQIPKFSAALKLSGSTKSARDAAFLDLYLLLLDDLWSPLREEGERAGLVSTLGSYRGALYCQLSGWRGSSQDLLLAFTECLNTVKPTHEEWDRQVRRLLENYANEERSLPYFQAVARLSDLIDGLPTAKERAAALRTAAHAEFLQFASQFAKTAYVEALFFGDIGKRESQVVWNDMKKNLGSSASHKPMKSTFAMSTEGPYLVRETTPLKGTATLLLVDAGKLTPKSRAKQELLSTILSEAFFDVLRTKQQTAYIAKASGKTTDDHLFIVFGVQSSSHAGEELLARFELFMEEFLRNLPTTLSQERFNELKQSIAVTLNRPFVDEREATRRLFSMAYERNHDFAYEQACSEEAENLTFEEFTAFAHDVLKRQNGGRLALLIEGQADKALRYRSGSLAELTRSK